MHPGMPGASVGSGGAALEHAAVAAQAREQAVPPAQIAYLVRLGSGFSCSPFRRLAAAEGIDVDVVNLPLAG